MYWCHLYASPNQISRGFLAGRRWPYPSRNWPAIMLVSHACCNRAAWLGWRFSNDLLQMVKRRCLASFTLATPQPLLYIRTTKRTIRCMCTESILKRVRYSVRATNVSVKSSKLVQTAQAIFLPQARNCEVVSHPVKLWKRGSARDFDGPRLEFRTWTGMSRYLFPLPKPTQSSDRPSVTKNRTEITTTSLSTVRT